MKNKLKLVKRNGKRTKCFVLTVILLYYFIIKMLFFINPLQPPGGSEWIISVGYYVDNSFTALGSSDPREVRLEL